MNRWVKQGLSFLIAVLMAIGCYFLSGIPRTEFLVVFVLFSAFFLGAIALFFLQKDSLSWQKIFWIGLLLRLSVSLFTPKWSDDYVRFLWDGELIEMGENPFAETPRQRYENPDAAQSDLLNQLFYQLNSPDYYSVYPPLNQLIFWVSVKISGGYLWSGFLALRLILLLGEMGTFFLFLSLFQAWKIPFSHLIWYWFNPLVILEITGNLHFEGLVLMLLLASIWALQRNRSFQAGACWGLSIGMKLLPLLLAPAFFYSTFISKKSKFWLGAGLALVGSMIGLFWEGSYLRFFESLRLYQGKFEFNASVYYLLREVGFWLVGYNTIATLTNILSGLTLGLILYFAWKKKSENPLQLVESLILSYLIYLILQPVIHPWYILPGVGLSVLTRKRTFLFWSFGAIFSYQAYGNADFQEKSIFLLLEYTLVLVGLFLDYYPRKRSSNFET